MKKIQEKLNQFWQSNSLELSTSKTLLAVSGGIDSMLLAKIFLEHNFQFAIAHVNYQLRGIASEKDADFVASWANQNDIPFFLKVVDLKSADSKNTQVVAREVRYSWFEELLRDNDFQFLATAHHLQDSVETSIINQGRGTGIKGMIGIPIQRGQIIRPLLCLTPREKEELCEHYNIEWREDESNATDQYLRNKIRHHIIPELVNIFPNFFNAQLLNKSNITSDQRLIEELVKSYKEKIFAGDQNAIKIKLALIENHPERFQLLFYMLQPWEFSATQIQQIWQNIDSDETRFFSTKNTNGALKAKLLVLDNKTIISKIVNVEQHEKNIDLEHGTLTFSKIDCPTILGKDRSEVYFSLEELSWPLIIRTWQTGDVFQPFGMGGKHQKVQDYFSNNKFTELEKRRQLLLCSGSKIMWIIGRRTSEYFKVLPQQKKCLCVKWTPAET